MIKFYKYRTAPCHARVGVKKEQSNNLARSDTFAQIDTLAQSDIFAQNNFDLFKIFI